jgi:hypothetical protein
LLEAEAVCLVLKFSEPSAKTCHQKFAQSSGDLGSVTLPSTQVKVIGLGRTNGGSVMLGTDNTARYHLGYGDAQITYSFDLCDIMLVRITDDMTPDFACLTIEP